MREAKMVRFMLAILSVSMSFIQGANAGGVGNLGAQFGGPPGFSKGSGAPQCVGKPLKYSQCIAAAGSPYAATGTFTVKANAEVLVYLICGGMVVWQGERFAGTSELSTPTFPAGVSGPCWVDWQMLNNTGVFQPDGALWEYQIAVYWQ